uniref:G-protein coupled receptors family 1 profile domain-containing protein n=1 Tax=Ciona savignyi TaxID=51511 RepID=H2YBN8_CIOSA
YSFLAVYMTFICLISCSLNILVITATLKNKVLRQPLNYIIVNLAVVDLLSGLVGGVISIFANGAGYFFWGKFMCQVEGYTVSNFGVTGLLSIAVMAFERYFVICKPFGPVRFEEKHAVIGIAVTWIWAMFWNTPPLIFWDGYDTEGLGTSCAPNWFVKGNTERLFIILYFVFCFLIPLAIIVLCYGKLIFTTSTESSLSGGTSPEGEVTKMVVVMVTAFVICWLPYAAFAMYNVVNPEAQIDYALGAAPAFFAKTATIYNPLIYIGLNRQFRDCVVRMIFNGRNPWVDEMVGSQVSSSASQMTAVSSNKVAPA